jgi:hypothetical protein
MNEEGFDYGRRKSTYPSVRSEDVVSGSNRILPRQLSTGSSRGTQTVGYGNTKIDGSNNRITIGAPDGSTIGMGAVPDSIENSFGFFSTNTSGSLVMQITDGTFYVYDVDNEFKNVIQIGRLPDGSYGMVVAKPGSSVEEAFQ